jgi:formate C-acetyltransferase
MAFVAEALENLINNPPSNTYEGLCLMYIFFVLQSEIENSYLRSFGSLDMLLYPLYKKDIEKGTFTKEQIRTLIKYFIQKLDSLKVWANQPFALCGTEGQEPVNELSYIILEEFVKLKPVYTKIHIRYSKEIPEDFILTICDSIRENGNSFVFINNVQATNALHKNGIALNDAIDYGVIGCYEVYAQGTELPCSGNGNVNMLKAVEAVIFNGYDALTEQKVFDEKAEPETYEEFLQQVKDYLGLFIDKTINVINAYEKGYPKMQFAPFLSSTYDSCMEKGMDIYSGGAKYNSSSINMVGTASCADSIFAVKTLVFDEKRLTLKELREVLKNNWENNEELRQYALSLHKYGNNYDDVDSIAKDVTSFCMNKINGRENGRSGTYRGGTWSITNRIPHGEKAGASPDGRKAKEPLSKNICAHTAQDKNGATAHILSALKHDYSLVPNGTVLDLALSHTAVKGDDGLKALKATLDVFMANGGFAIQYNVLNPATLKEAQCNPEQYKNLQVRLCGWNVLFSSLSKQEQDDFILQSEVI